MNKKAVVFDMDGVIFDSEKIYRMFWKKTAAAWNLPLEHMDEVCEGIAGGTKAHNREVFQSFFGQDFDYDTYREDMYRRMDAYLEENQYDIKTGAEELLIYLKENGYQIALATSTKEKRAAKFLKRAGLFDNFDQKIYGDMIPLGMGKPEPFIYLKACEALGVKPEEAIGVEDSINGVTACSRAGLYTVMVVDMIKPTDETKKMTDQVFYSLTELQDFLEKKE